MERIIPLLTLEIGASANVSAILSSKKAMDKLRQLGVFEGVKLILLRKAPLKGPLLVEVSGRELALGYALSEKIMVEAQH
ncbi:MAG: FeoA family protein [Anaerolineaceae bacterium]|nr:FeoA family protein [Anaerolineaceae bacterium]